MHDPLQRPPQRGITVLRLSALSAATSALLDDETRAMLCQQVQAGVLEELSPREVWAELLPGLMEKHPSNMLRNLHDCGALQRVLPEVTALFGVFQIANDPEQVDIGCHVLRVLDQAARCDAPLSVRFAALVMNAGKSDSPPEHLPVHYRHIERGRQRIENICERFGVERESRDLALLALAECERVHRASEVRAGPVAAMLERLGAFSDIEHFERLLLLCACDYRAYPGYEAKSYPKSALLHRALAACKDIDADEFDEDELMEARALAIAAAFKSERWSEKLS
ncbi:MAG: tRNA nucleotidyltransferase [Gammaproteobacteria bacterium]|nr:tRNA nucleotidyltransferase [Gammaproteobacteria bacterium]